MAGFGKPKHNGGYTMNNGTTKDQDITDYLNGLYAVLLDSEHPLASEMLGMVAEIKAGWEGDLGSFSE